MTIPDNTLYHLTQSSNLLKLKGQVFIFDYPEPARSAEQGAGLAQGIVRPEDLAGETVYVVISHSHADHFNREIFSWADTIENITYVLSHEIPDPPETALGMKPGRSFETGGMAISAYSSTDAGVACSLFYQGYYIYFSGDNAFWNWDGDLDDDIYIRTVLSEIPREPPMDIAFQVCDPRLDGKGDGGIHVFARHFNPRLLVPIHAFGRYEFNRTAEKRLREKGFDNRFWCVAGRGHSCRIDDL